MKTCFPRNTQVETTMKMDFAVILLVTDSDSDEQPCRKATSPYTQKRFTCLLPPSSLIIQLLVSSLPTDTTHQHHIHFTHPDYAPTPTIPPSIPCHSSSSPTISGNMPSTSSSLTPRAPTTNLLYSFCLSPNPACA